jgi:hypothetical protein
MAMRAVWPSVARAIPPGIWTEIRALVSEFAKFKKGMPELFYWKKPVMLFEAVKNHILQNHRVFPNMTEMEDTSLQYAAAAVRVQPTTSVKPPQQKHSHERKSFRREKRKPEGNLLCYICEDTNHLFLHCPIPKGERVRHAVTTGRCPCCLARDHAIGACARKRMCRLCDINKASDLTMIFHHFSLCPKGNGQPAKRLRRSDLVNMVKVIKEYDMGDISSSDTDICEKVEED